jgi:hypothetical protein
MKFIADVMLGRLATWLRLLGHDVLYDRSLNDRQILRLAQEQGRTIITRDTGLIRNRAARDSIFITSDHIVDQLAEMQRHLGCLNRVPRGRCARCNGELEDRGRTDDIREIVPDYIFHSHEQFLQCRICGNVYWEGSHYRHMKETLQQVFR